MISSLLPKYRFQTIFKRTILTRNQNLKSLFLLWLPKCSLKILFRSTFLSLRCIIWNWWYNFIMTCFMLSIFTILEVLISPCYQICIFCLNLAKWLFRSGKLSRLFRLSFTYHSEFSNRLFKGILATVKTKASL